MFCKPSQGDTPGRSNAPQMEAMADLAVDHRLSQRPYSSGEGFAHCGIAGGFDARNLQNGPEGFLVFES